MVTCIQDESWPADELNVLIEVYSFQASAIPAVENLFVEINSAEPVKAIDMPIEVGRQVSVVVCVSFFSKIHAMYAPQL